MFYFCVSVYPLQISITFFSTIIDGRCLQFSALFVYECHVVNLFLYQSDVNFPLMTTLFLA